MFIIRKWHVIAFAVFVACFLGFFVFEESNRPVTDVFESSVMTFATCATYPPFQYKSGNDLVGFEIDLVNLIASKIGKKVVFREMQFDLVLAALESGAVDAAVSTLTITEKRKESFDFSVPYYSETLSLVYNINDDISSIDDLQGMDIACQLGTTMQLWLEENAEDSNIVLADDTNKAVQLLKSKRVKAVLMDGVQAKHFTKMNSGLTYRSISKIDQAYAIAFVKSSPYKSEFDKVIKELEVSGQIDRLKDQYSLDD